MLSFLGVVGVLLLIMCILFPPLWGLFNIAFGIGFLVLITYVIKGFLCWFREMGTKARMRTIIGMLAVLFSMVSVVFVLCLLIGWI